MICIHCGHGALRIHVTSGQAECLSTTCAKHMPLTGKADRDRLRRIALGRIPWRGKPAEQCPDGPQYKAYGNSMAVPVMRWIGERIQMVAALQMAEVAA